MNCVKSGSERAFQSGMRLKSGLESNFANPPICVTG